MGVKCPKCHSENTDTARFCSNCATPLEQVEEFQASHTRTIEPPLEELSTGSVFAGRYQIIEELGRGGMGRVYKALDKKINEEVAIKLIKPEIASEKKTLDRFANELKIARRISHKNVGRMYHLSEDKGTHYITMEFIRGEDLKHMIRMSRHLSFDTAVGIARQIAEGLAEAHRQGIVHRDLKPGNIMIDREGNPKVMDFGIARLLGGKGITGAGAVVGTPDYMSPEQFEGKDVDGRADVYSLGIILYEMLTGRVPFEADTALAVGYKHKHEAPLSPKSLNPQIPDDLSGLVLRCLEKDPDKRPQTSDELRADLEMIEKGLPSTTKLTPATRRTSLTSREITIKFTAKKLLMPGLPIVGGIAAVILALIFLPHRTAPPKASPIYKQITFTGKASYPAISADGKFLAYVDGLEVEEQKVLVKDVISGQAIEVFRGRECSYLRWSPDGSELTLCARENDSTMTAYLVPRLGGKPRRLSGMEWAPVWSSKGDKLLHFSWDKNQFIFTDKATGESKGIPLDKALGENLEEYALSPSGKFIAFTTSDPEGKYSIWTLSADGSRKNKIVQDTDNWLGSPRWSAGGDAIYYVQDADQTEDIRKMSVSPDSGKPAKPPSPILEGHMAGNFDLTADGKRLFYEQGPFMIHIWQAARTGSEENRKADLKPLTTGTSSNYCPSLSPDGKLMAFITIVGSSSNIFVMPAGGGPAQQITFLSSWCYGPVWSPDGKEIAFGSNQGGSNRIWKVSSAGGQPTQFAKTEGANNPTWAPGQRILYQSSKDKNFWLIDPTTEAVTPLFKTNPVDYIVWPRYSPDGRKIAALWHKESGKDPGLWLVSLEDLSSVKLRKGRAFPISWSPDGKWIYAAEKVAANLEILAVSAETGQSKPWLSLPPNPEIGQILSMWFSTNDGIHFVFPARRTQPDIWMIENFDPEIR